MTAALVECFSIFAVSEHCPFDEQPDLLESSTDYTYNYMGALRYFGNMHSMIT